MDWYLHEDHGYMLRGPAEGGHQMVVTALCLNTRAIEEGQGTWERHKSRLYVNTGSGAVVAALMRVGDHNPDFKPVPAGSVPQHIVREFEAYL